MTDQGNIWRRKCLKLSFHMNNIFSVKYLNEYENADKKIKFHYAIYVFIHSLCYVQDVIQDEFLSDLNKLV